MVGDGVDGKGVHEAVVEAWLAFGQGLGPRTGKRLLTSEVVAAVVAAEDGRGVAAADELLCCWGCS